MPFVSAPLSAITPPYAPPHPDTLYYPLPTLRPGQVLFRTTGAAEIHVGPSVVLTPSSERLFTIMVLCAMSPDHVMARSQMLEYAWPDTDVKSARHTLRQQLYRLRQLGVPLTSNRAAVVLDASCLVPSFSLGRTAEQFERDVLRGQEPFGQLFAGWRPENEVLLRWVEQQRDRYHMDVRRVLLPELHRLRDRAEWLECERWARTVLEFDPLHEDATLMLAEAIAMQGSRVDARSMLDGYARETGVTGTELARQVDEARRRIGRATRVRFEHSATPTLIGRDAELQQLDALTLAAMQGETKIVHILGPTGIGKTELAYEATRRAVILGFTRCIVRVTRPMGQVPYGTLSRLVRDLLKLPGALGCRPESNSMLTLLTGVDSECAESEPNGFAYAPASLAEALFDVVCAISFERPLYLLLDDIQHSDDASRELIERALDLIRGQRVVVVFTERTDSDTAKARSWRSDPAHAIPLAPLSLAESQRLAENVSSASGRVLDKKTAAVVASCSDRTPLEIITLAREHLVTGITSPTRVSVVELLVRQVLRLPTHARVLVQSLALIGGRCKSRELSDLLGLQLAACLEGLSILLDYGLAQTSEDDTITIHEELVQAGLQTLRESEATLLRRGLARSFARQTNGSSVSDHASLALSLALDSADRELFVSLCLKLSPVLVEKGLVHAATRFLESCYQLSQTENERREALRLLVDSARRAAQWQRVLTASAELATLAAGSNGELDTDAHLAVLEGTIHSSIHLDQEVSITKALEIAIDERNAHHNRIKGARLLITAATDRFDASNGIAAFQILQTLTPEDARSQHEYRETAMQYHAIFGDLSEAFKIAVDFFSTREELASLHNGIRTVTNASLVFRLCGDVNRAFASLDFCEAQPIVRDSSAMLVDVLWRRCVTAIDTDDSKLTGELMRRFTEFARESGEDNNLWVKLFQLRLELIRTGDIENCEVARRIADNVSLRPNRLELYCVALCLKSSSFRRRHREFAALLERATKWLSEYGRYTGFDFLGASVLEGLELLGRYNRAQEIACRYFEADRRERFVPGLTFSGVSASTRARFRITGNRDYRATNP